MRKPKSLGSFAGILFLIFGALFFICSVLLHSGIMKTSPNSIGDPGVAFPILTAALLATGIVICLLVHLKARCTATLLYDGAPITAQILSVQQLMCICCGNSWDSSSHPYVVSVEYELDGMQYKGKSHLLWERPAVHKGDEITVYIDLENPKHCAIKL